MRAYKNKQELMDEITKRAELFIGEFDDMSEARKDTLVDGVDRTPAQMIAYQLGWMRLLLEWEEKENSGMLVQTPHGDYKWNNLSGLHQSFYDLYKGYSMQELQREFREVVGNVQVFVGSLSDENLFEPGGRKWAASTPANWPVWKWVHINTVAPFATFRTKIRRWKRNS